MSLRKKPPGFSSSVSPSFIAVTVVATPVLALPLSLSAAVASTTSNKSGVRDQYQPRPTQAAIASEAQAATNPGREPEAPAFTRERTFLYALETDMVNSA